MDEKFVLSSTKRLWLSNKRLVPPIPLHLQEDFRTSRRICGRDPDARRMSARGPIAGIAASARGDAISTGRR
jgi:hypothetical protein